MIIYGNNIYICHSVRTNIICNGNIVALYSVVDRGKRKIRGMGDRVSSVVRSESILLIQSLLKESIDIWDESLKPDKVSITNETVESVVGDMKHQIKECFLELESAEVSTVVGGYVQKKLLNRTKCDKCKILLKSDMPLLRMSHRSICPYSREGG